MSTRRQHVRLMHASKSEPTRALISGGGSTALPREVKEMPAVTHGASLSAEGNVCQEVLTTTSGARETCHVYGRTLQCTARQLYLINCSHGAVESSIPVAAAVPAKVCW